MGMPDHITHAADVEKVRELVAQNPELERHLRHHLRNSLAVIILALHAEEIEPAKLAAAHILSDLREVNL